MLECFNGSAWTVIQSNTSHYIGESYGGGTVFYITPDALHGLIAETQDQCAGCNFWNATNYNSIAAYHSIAGSNYTDWRYPTLNELLLLYAKKAVVGGFANLTYWSTIEENDYIIFETVFFGDGLFGGSSKFATLNARAVRSF